MQQVVKKSLAINVIHFERGKVLVQFSRIPLREEINIPKLIRQKGILDVDFSQSKKALLISYDSSVINIKRYFEDLKESVSDMEVIFTGVKKNDHKKSRDSQDDFLSAFIRTFSVRTNTSIRKSLGNTADLTSLVPLGLIALALIEFSRRPLMPKWNELAWYGYSMFRDFNSSKQFIPHFES